MSDIVLPAKDAPDYKEKLSEKRRALMAMTRQKKKDNSIIKQENHKQKIVENKINRKKDKEEFEEFKKLKQQAENKINEDIVNEDNESEEEEEIIKEKVKPKKVIKPKPKPKKQVVIEESESDESDESDEEQVIYVKKPKKKELQRRMKSCGSIVVMLPNLKRYLIYRIYLLMLN